MLVATSAERTNNECARSNKQTTLKTIRKADLQQLQRHGTRFAGATTTIATTSSSNSNINSSSRNTPTHTHTYTMANAQPRQ